ncbi:hypothetical protein LWI28_023998 [Acer negundo]|uniref:Uncharacterized protein n=1 Tax=Acer negundo TaxID=4023 RepID=A0AAD5NP50_ACENE|nr:hypothetical protein LWI28_023998 [Acer negundo]
MEKKENGSIEKNTENGTMELEKKENGSIKKNTENGTMEMEKKENASIEKNTENGTMEIEKAVDDDDNDEPKINYRGWKAMPYIIGNETFEKLGAIGTLANLHWDLLLSLLSWDYK